MNERAIPIFRNAQNNDKSRRLGNNLSRFWDNLSSARNFLFEQPSENNPLPERILRNRESIVIDSDESTLDCRNDGINIHLHGIRPYFCCKECVAEINNIKL